MAIAFVIAWVGAQGNSVTSVTATGINTTGANFIAVAVTDNLTLAAVNPVTDSNTNTYQKALGPLGAGDNVYQYYAESPTVGASHTITATSSAGSSFLTLCAAAYSGMASSSTIDKTQSGTGTGTSLDSGNTATTSQADELLIGNGTVSTGGSVTWSAGASYTNRATVTNADIGGIGYIEERIVAATGAYSAPESLSGGTGGWTALIGTYKAAGAAAVFVPYQPNYLRAPVMAQ